MLKGNQELYFGCIPSATSTDLLQNGTVEMDAEDTAKAESTRYGL